MTMQSHIIDDLNYLNDPRNCRPDEVPMLTLEDGTEIPLPFKWEVCGVCNGAGKHVNPSIDAGGLSAEKLHDDPDFAEAYFTGAYDETCKRCGGRTTERVIDLDAMKPEHRAEYESQQRADASYAAECRVERLLGC